MAKLKGGEPVWYCFGCQDIVYKRLALVDGLQIVCEKYECVASVILSETYKAIPKKVEPEHPAICPTCKGEWKMAIKKTLPMTVRSKEQLLHEQAFSGTEYDPGYVESLTSKIIRGAEKPPVGTVFAKDMVFDTVYANYEGTRRIMKLVALRKDDVEVTFYSGNHREWLKCSVPLMYPLTTDLAGIVPEQQLKEKETKMAKKDRKHTGAGKVSTPARAVNEKTGCKEGSVGDQVGTAFLAYKTYDKQFEAMTEVITASFKAKGKSTAKDAVERQVKSWIGFLRKTYPAIYPAAEKAEKPAKVKAKTPKAKKQPVAA